MKILVTGAAGVIGSRLVKRLADAGHDVRALVLPNDTNIRRLEGVKCHIVNGDVTVRDSLCGVFDDIDMVYHLAAAIVSKDPKIFRSVNVEGARNVVSAGADAGVRHFIHASSASVTYTRETYYSRSKKDAEIIVRGEKRFRHTIVRPTLVYDSSGGQEMEMLASHIRRFPVVPFIGAGRAKKRPVYAGDIIEGLARIAGNEKTFGKTYNFSGGEAVTMLELARLMIQTLKLRRIIVPVPEFLCRACAEIWGAIGGNGTLLQQAITGFTQDADLDFSEAKTDLGYSPIPVSEGLPKYFHQGEVIQTS